MPVTHSVPANHFVPYTITYRVGSTANWTVHTPPTEAHWVLVINRSATLAYYASGFPVAGGALVEGAARTAGQGHALATGEWARITFVDQQGSRLRPGQGELQPFWTVGDDFEFYFGGRP